MKKVISCAIGVTLSLSLLLSGCGNATKVEPSGQTKDEQTSTAEKSTEAKQATVKYWDYLNDSDPNDLKAKWVKNNIKLFEEKNTNIKIELTNVPNGDQYLNKISTEMAANNTPDVFYFWAHDRMKPFAEAGRMEPLNDYIKDDAQLTKVLNNDLLKFTTFSGNVYGFPVQTSGELVFINKALFSKYGVKIPETWEELLTAVKVFKDNKMVPIALGNKDAWTGTIPYMLIFKSLFGPSAYDEVVVNKQAKFNGSMYVEAAKYLVNLKDAGAFSKNINSVAYDEGIAMFTAGKSPMCITGVWELANFTKNMGNDVDITNFVSMPNGKGNRDTDWIVNVDQIYCMGSESKVKQDAFKFISFMFSNDRQAEYAEGGMLLASRNIDYDKSKLAPLVSKTAGILSSATGIVIPWDNLLGLNVGKECNLATQAIYGGAAVETTLDKLNKVAQNEWKK